MTNIRGFFFLAFHLSLPLACILFGFGDYFFFYCYSCCSLEDGRKKPVVLSQPGCRWGFCDLTPRAGHGKLQATADASQNTQPLSTEAVKPQRCWCWRPVWLVKWGTSWGGSRQSHCSVIFSLKHPPTAPCCEYIPPDLWMSPHLGKPCRATGRWVWPATATASSRLHTDEV